jgi:hypothetical protein
MSSELPVSRHLADDLFEWLNMIYGSSARDNWAFKALTESSDSRLDASFLGEEKMGRESDDNSTAEIEVTEAMIEAGVTELALCESGDSWRSTAEAVYLAMEVARRQNRDRPNIAGLSRWLLR